MSKSQKWKRFFFLFLLPYFFLLPKWPTMSKKYFSHFTFPVFFSFTLFPSQFVSLLQYPCFFLFCFFFFLFAFTDTHGVKKDKVQADHWTFSAPAFYLLSAMAFVGSVTFPVSVWLHSHRTCLALSFFSFLDHCNILQSSGSPPYSKTTSATSQHTSITHSDTHPWFLRPSLTRSQDKVLLLFYQ